MGKNIINFFDHHRLILILIILLLASIIFLGLNSFIFLHHDFIALECDNTIDEIYCETNNVIILQNASKSVKQFFKDNQKEIDDLKETYSLNEFNNYTAYYYYTAAKIDYNINPDNDTLYSFFSAYINTYDLENFYLKNNFYFQIFYPYKLG